MIFLKKQTHKVSFFGRQLKTVYYFQLKTRHGKKFHFIKRKGWICTLQIHLFCFINRANVLLILIFLIQNHLTEYLTIHCYRIPNSRKTSFRFATTSSRIKIPKPTNSARSMNLSPGLRPVIISYNRKKT